MKANKHKKYCPYEENIILLAKNIGTIFFVV